MNKSMVIGLVGGIGIATAGGVAGYALLSQSGAQDQGAIAVVEPAVEASPAVDTRAVRETSSAPVQTAESRVPAPAPRPAATQAAAPRAAAQPATAQAAAAPAASPQPAPEQRCWDEEVTVQADPKDDKAIAGTAAGAVLGGAIAKKLGDDNDLATAAGAAAGALAGRRLQRRVQENNTTTVIEHRCEPAL